MSNKEKVIIRKAPDYNPEIIKKIIQEGIEDFGLAPQIKGRITIKPNVVMAHPKVAPSAFTRGPFGLQELVNIKFISHDFSRKKTQIWWYPYSTRFPKLLEKSLVLFHDHQLLKKIKTLFSLLSHRSRIRAGSPLFNFIKNIPKIIRK